MRVDSVWCAGFLLLAFLGAGIAQTAWLRSAWSKRFAWPLDGGHRWRGQPVFGDNKTWTGFIVMVPATGCAFAVLARGVAGLAGGGDGRVWPLSIAEYFWLGVWAGLGFMLGELPNSFIKRRLNVVPGGRVHNRVWRWLGTLVDQADSVIGALLALACFVSIPWLTWCILLITGPLLHWIFNIALWLLGVKQRAA